MSESVQKKRLAELWGNFEQRDLTRKEQRELLISAESGIVGWEALDIVRRELDRVRIVRIHRAVARMNRPEPIVMKARTAENQAPARETPTHRDAATERRSHEQDEGSLPSPTDQSATGGCLTIVCSACQRGGPCYFGTGDRLAGVVQEGLNTGRIVGQETTSERG